MVRRVHLSSTVCIPTMPRWGSWVCRANTAHACSSSILPKHMASRKYSWLLGIVIGTQISVTWTVKKFEKQMVWVKIHQAEEGRVGVGLSVWERPKTSNHPRGKRRRFSVRLLPRLLSKSPYSHSSGQMRKWPYFSRTKLHPTFHQRLFQPSPLPLPAVQQTTPF